MSRNIEILRYFQFEHLPEGPLKETSRMFSEFADTLDALLPGVEQQRVALNKLLEAKDAAVRAALDLPKDTKVNIRRTYFQSDEPTDAYDGDVWFDPDNPLGYKQWNALKNDWDEKKVAN